MTNDTHRDLWCFIKDDPNVFEVTAPVDASIGRLKKLVWEEGKNGVLSNVDAKDLVLWKLKAAEPAEPLDTLPQRIALAEVVKLEDLWATVSDKFSEEPKARSIHIVVEPKSADPIATGKRLPSSPHPEEPSLKLHRANYFHDFPNTAPSALAQPSEFSNIQDNPATRMFCNRPRTANSTPITLLHPVFGQFVTDSKDHPLDPKIACFALELATEMCKFYKSESERAQAFRDLIFERLDIELKAAKVEGTEFSTDGHAFVGFHVYVNTECKNEIGSTLADPCLQSAIYYHHHTKYSVGKKVQNSRFPCLHLYYFGSHLGFAGSAFSDRVHYEPLTTLIPLWFSPHDTDMLDTITRFFSAFKNAASTLKTYYTELLAQTSTAFTTEDARFPYPTTFTHLQTYVNAPLKLEHQAMLGKLLYGGLTEAGQRVAVKFVRRYSKELHEHCASKHLAPALLGFEKLAGGWFMVVMEHMDGYETLATLKDRASIPTQLQQMVRDLVTSFHAQKFVHGDIRDSNLLVRSDGKLEMKLIDFDWGGKEGEVCYPVLINNRTLHRPPGVVGSQLITREHDLLMVENIF